MTHSRPSPLAPPRARRSLARSLARTHVELAIVGVHQRPQVVAARQPVHRHVDDRAVEQVPERRGAVPVVRGGAGAHAEAARGGEAGGVLILLKRVQFSTQSLVVIVVTKFSAVFTK